MFHVCAREDAADLDSWPPAAPCRGDATIIQANSDLPRGSAASCPNVPDHLLDPRNTWANAENYDEKAHNLAAAFVKNFEQYAGFSSPEIINAGPNMAVTV